MGPRDSLTGYPERPMLLDLLARPNLRHQQRRGLRTALLVLDLSRFRGVNDALGHELGDRLLVSLTERVEAQLPTDSTLARLGGGCLAVLLEGLLDSNRASRVANRIHTELTKPFHLAGNEIFVNISMGLALNQGSEDRPENLLRDAETALYHAKNSGSHLEIFRPSLRFEAVARFQLENELRQALERRQFRLAFQPIFSLPQRRLVGFEALLRWQHPRRGTLCPREFLPIAIEMGLISPIDQWVLTEACRQLASWRQQSSHGDQIWVSTNLTAPEILDSTLPVRVEQALGRQGLEARDLKLELTEWARLEPSPQVKGAIRRLRERGIGILVDDFGTGYSCLSYLHYIPGEALKIDRSFIAGLGVSKIQTQVVASIVRLAQELDMVVVAEGVETVDQLQQLEALGCHRAQGFLLGVPLSSEAVSDFLRGQTVTPPMQTRT